MRYEDLAVLPSLYFAEIFSFLGLDFTEAISDYLKVHTTAQDPHGDHFSVSRVSKTAPFRWKEQLSFEEIHAIQDRCSDAMNKWRYHECDFEEGFGDCEPCEIDYGGLRSHMVTPNKTQTTMATIHLAAAPAPVFNLSQCMVES